MGAQFADFVRNGPLCWLHDLLPEAEESIHSESELNPRYWHDESGQNILFYAMKRDSSPEETLEVVHLLVAKLKVQFDRPDHWEQTPLFLATARGLGNIVQYLLLHQANPDKRDKNLQTPLFNAARHGHVHCANLLLRAYARPDVQDTQGQTPLHYAARYEATDVVHTLLHVRCHSTDHDTSGRVPLDLAPSMHSASAKLLWEHSPGASPSVYPQRPMLLCGSPGTGVFAPDPLPAAVVQGDYKTALSLLRRGEPATMRSRDGLTLLFHAALGTCDDAARKMCELLVEFHAAVSWTDWQGRTALFYAASLGHAHCSKFFIEKGMNANHRDLSGQTPIHLAVVHEKIECVRLLLTLRSSLHERDKRGFSVLDHATHWGAKEEMLSLLQQSGAKSMKALPPAPKPTGSVAYKLLQLKRRADADCDSSNVKGVLPSRSAIAQAMRAIKAALEEDPRLGQIKGLTDLVADNILRGG